MISIDLLKNKLIQKGVEILPDVYSARRRINNQECKTLTINITKSYDSENKIVELLINKYDCKQFAFFTLLPKHLRVIVVSRDIVKDILKTHSWRY